MLRSGNAVLLTTPKLGRLNRRPGVPNGGVLKALNISKRNSTSFDSMNRNCLKTDRSKFETPSVLTLCLPESPYWRTLVPGTKSGQPTFDVSIQRAGVGFDNSTAPKMFGRA